MRKAQLTSYDIESILGLFNKRFPEGGILSFNKYLFRYKLINLVSVRNYLSFVSDGRCTIVTPDILLKQFTHGCEPLLRNSLLEYISWLYKMGLLHERNCYEFLKRNDLKFDEEKRWKHNA